MKRNAQAATFITSTHVVQKRTKRPNAAPMIVLVRVVLLRAANNPVLVAATAKHVNLEQRAPLVAKAVTAAKAVVVDRAAYRANAYVKRNLPPSVTEVTRTTMIHVERKVQRKTYGNRFLDSSL